MKISGFFKVLCPLLLFCILMVPEASGFGLPEKLVYDLTWTGITAGTATLDIAQDEDLVRIVSTARSASWVSVFYTVDDKIETLLSRPTVSRNIGLPRHYRVKIREGRHRRDKEVFFNHGKGKALFEDHIAGEKKDIDIQENTLDPLSGFYYLRTLKFEVGKSAFVEMLDNKKLWNVEVQVLRKERIQTKLGSFDTIVIKPLIKSEGIFNRRGDMYIWLTDDAKHLPVKMQTKVAVGSVTAVLVGGEY